MGEYRQNNLPKVDFDFFMNYAKPTNLTHFMKISTKLLFHVPKAALGVRRYGNYTKALVREIDSSAVESTQRTGRDRSSLDVLKAKEQHEQLIDALRSTGLFVTSLPPCGSLDSAFLEYAAVLAGGTALLTSTRSSGETDVSGDNLLRSLLHSSCELLESSLPQQRGSIDGRDVLFTGSEFVAAETSQTSLQGLLRLSLHFPLVPVLAVPLLSLRPNKALRALRHDPERPLHLKSMCSMAGPRRVLLGGPYSEALHRLVANPTVVFVNGVALIRPNSQENDESQTSFQKTNELVDDSQKAALEVFKSVNRNYEFIHVFDEAAANCVFANGTLIRRADDEFPLSKKTLAGLGGRQIQVSVSELDKVNGALSCCSLLI